MVAVQGVGAVTAAAMEEAAVVAEETGMVAAVGGIAEEEVAGGGKPAFLYHLKNSLNYKNRLIHSEKPIFI